MSQHDMPTLAREVTTVYTKDIARAVREYTESGLGAPIIHEMLVNVLADLRILADLSSLDFFKALDASYIQYLQTRKVLAAHATQPRS